MRIDEVEGIGAAYAAKLGGVGINTTDDLIMAAASAAGREKVAGMTGITAGQLLEWVNHVDLMRIEGVGPEYADLLEAAGVDSPAELAQRNAANLAQTFQEIDAARPNWVRRVPSEATVAGWIASAAEMEKVVSH
jgi:predicted flap endonuclease-1-like 5' DNA nuclease